MLDDLQVIDDLFDALHLKRERAAAGFLLAGFDFTGELVSTPTRVRLTSLSEASLVLTYEVRVPSSMFCPMVSPVVAWQPVMKKRTTNLPTF
jgi:hypothetical protein